jgi:uncharacterized protein YecE (DUF72 family)
MPGVIRIGTASWTDPGFIADWYPANLAAGDRLRYYAERFNFVEVNSSFYAVPARQVVQRWCDQTPDGFVFDVKLHRLLSRHSTALQSLPPSLRGLADARGDQVQLTPGLESALTKAFLEEVRPLNEANKLGAFLLQITPAFGPKHHRLEELDNLLHSLAGFRVAVELRNRHWMTGDQSNATAAFFQKRGVSLVSVDAPDSAHFMVMPGVDVVTDPKLAYLRLHGRNAKGYITGKSVAERFDYLYSEDELKSIAERVSRLADQTAETHVVYNNNASDYPLRNAATFQQLLARKYPNTRTGPARSQAHPNQTLEFDFGS